MKQGVLSLGEVILDMVSVDQTNEHFQPYLGGATVNVAVGVSRQGLPSYYISKLGEDDSTTHFIEKALGKEKVDISYSVRNSEKQICKVYIRLDENGDRTFHAYVNETPDIWLTEEELVKEVFDKTKFFYFGSGTLFHPIARKLTEQALNFANDVGTLVAFDTNIRLKRWNSEAECKTIILEYMLRADLVKMAEDELLFLTGRNDLTEAITIAKEWRIPYLFVTLGKEGAIVLHNSYELVVEGLKVNAIDTTGAGDAFMAGVLYWFHEKGMPHNGESLERCLHYANQMGAEATTRTGAL